MAKTYVVHEFITDVDMSTGISTTIQLNHIIIPIWWFHLARMPCMHPDYNINLFKKSIHFIPCWKWTNRNLKNDNGSLSISLLVFYQYYPLERIITQCSWTQMGKRHLVIFLRMDQWPGEYSHQEPIPHHSLSTKVTTYNPFLKWQRSTSFP